MGLVAPTLEDSTGGIRGEFREELDNVYRSPTYDAFVNRDGSARL